jgi:hypothetical protein
MTFFRNINVPVPAESELEILYAQWGLSCYSVRLRDFLYKFRNNLLGLNTRVAHFNNNVNRGCTFCCKSGINPAPDESFGHLFFNCRFTNKVISDFVNRYLHDLNLITEERKKLFFFLGSNPNTGKTDNYFILTIASVAMYYIWECKLKKKHPNLNGTVQ